VLPAIDRVLNGDWRSGHSELARLLTGDLALSPNARARACCGVALVESIQNGDATRALLALAPCMKEADGEVLSPDVAARVFAVAALVHSLPSASVFDIGRVHAYAARAEALGGRDREVSFLGIAATIYAAILSGDRELALRGLARLKEGGWSSLPRLFTLIAEEGHAFDLLMAGKALAHLQAVEALVERAERADCPLLLARALGYWATRLLDDLADPEQALHLARRSLSIIHATRAPAGMHQVFAVRSEAEALFRLGRVEEAIAALDGLDVFAKEAGFVATAAVSAQVRIFTLTGRLDRMRALASLLEEVTVPSLRPISHANLSYVEAMIALAQSDNPTATVRAFERAERDAERWTFLLRDVLSFRVLAHLVAGEDREARFTLRRLQRVLDAFPSGWMAAQLRRLEGMELAARGDWLSGRALLEAATATFELSRARPDVCLARYAVAVLGQAHGDPGAKAEVESALVELGRIGLKPPRGLQVAMDRLARDREDPASAKERRHLSSAELLVVPVQRLSVRGGTPVLIQRELVTIVASMFPERSVRLEEVDSQGRTAIVSSERDASGDFEWAEFGDGAGRHLRLGVSGELEPAERASLNVLVQVAALSLEVAAFRGYGSRAEAGAETEASLDLPGFVAASASMRKLGVELQRLGGSRATVIITGESGSGKEVVARAIHELSDRKRRAYVAFNCAAVPHALFEGQLFGYRRGAFTGAVSDQPGVIRSADGGTLFLDEVGELPLDVQPKLLRFLENGEVSPLGEQKPIRVDVRVLAATHRDLALLVREGGFRQDLYYRLQVIPIHLPPLRDRRDDIVPLARHFVAALSGDRSAPILAPDAMEALLSHDWPGNVRELRNVIERTLAFLPLPDVLRAEHLRIAADG
jgi:hypothetical protein